MKQEASITARMSAFVRAYHTEQEENPVFADPIARMLFTDAEYEQMENFIAKGADFFIPKLNGRKIEKQLLLDCIICTQLAPTPIARAKYCEDCLKTAIRTGTKQYVILGAGYDTFAWRENELMKKITLFEADHPLTQADKQKRLSRAGLEMPSHLHFVPVDFTKDHLKERLLENGFDMTQKTFFSWLGVSYYLTDEQIRKLLAEISGFASEGSTLVFDYADSGLFSSDIQRVKNMLAMAQAGGEPMHFCCDRPELSRLLEDYHFLIYEDLTPDDIDSQILNDSDITAFEHIHYAAAVIKNTGYIHTKEKILQTALRLFAKRGYNAVSVRDIAGELGITQAALYRHYKNKEDIFYSILRRMEKQHSAQAKESCVPEKQLEQTPEDYKNTKPVDWKDFTLSMFRYWTQDAFAAAFRKMLTLEQYRNHETARLYEQYLSVGPLHSIRDRLHEMGCKDPMQKAVALYAPVFLLMNLYDTAENKSEIYNILKNHIHAFTID